MPSGEMGMPCLDELEARWCELVVVRGRGDAEKDWVKSTTLGGKMVGADVSVSRRRARDEELGKRRCPGTHLVCEAAGLR